LRLPDLLCVKTGLRVEVRAKSDLKIKMSDAPNNPDRAWDAGLRADDLVAFIACFDSESGPMAADEATFFSVHALRASVGGSKLGPPKSASEGSERDREWPAIIPSRDGVVEQVRTGPEEIQGGKLVVLMDEENDRRPPRRQTYTLNGKNAYVCPGDRFRGKASIIAGLPPALARLQDYCAHTYDPLAALDSPNDVDRYSAAKAVPYRQDLGAQAVGRLETLIRQEVGSRVALEAAGAAAAMGSVTGQDYIRGLLTAGHLAALRMEAIFILTELRTPFALDELRRVADGQSLTGNEFRQAAVWGIGKSGHRSYHDLLRYIDDDDENVALHAIAAFGTDTPGIVVDELVRRLDRNAPRLAAAASEVLRLVGGEYVLKAVAAAARLQPECEEWALGTLGRLDPDLVRKHLAGNPLLERVAPLLCVFGDDNWLNTGERPASLAFLLAQYL
jgi:hypothetical protein